MKALEQRRLISKAMRLTVEGLNKAPLRRLRCGDGGLETGTHSLDTLRMHPCVPTVLSALLRLWRDSEGWHQGGLVVVVVVFIGTQI